jgi:hypothetical protein|tara:strand:- start:60 stop:218 length:159 start_codon:yes stop_codon:yes gene_type:complete
MSITKNVAKRKTNLKILENGSTTIVFRKMGVVSSGGDSHNAREAIARPAITR